MSDFAGVPPFSLLITKVAPQYPDYNDVVSQRAIQSSKNVLNIQSLQLQIINFVILHLKAMIKQQIDYLPLSFIWSNRLFTKLLITRFLIITDFFHNKITVMIPSIRSSLGSHHTSMPTIQIEPALDSQRIEKCLDYFRMNLRQHLKERQFLFQEQQLNYLYKLAKTMQSLYSRNQKEHQTVVNQLRTQNQETSFRLQQKIAKLKHDLSQELEEKETAFNQKLLAIKNQNGRKEQTYKDTIQQLMTAVNTLQKKYQNLQAAYNLQLQTITTRIQRIMSKRKREQYVSVVIKQLIEQITLRQQNSFISSKADEMSLDQIILNPTDQNQSGIIADEFPETSLEKQLQNYIIKLVCFGFFTKTNEDCLKKMVAFTSNYEQPCQLLQQKVFPVILEVLTNNMRKYHKLGLEYLQGPPNSGELEEHSRIQLRNIINLSDLSINTASQLSVNQSQFDQMNFKKSKQF